MARRSRVWLLLVAVFIAGGQLGFLFGWRRGAAGCVRTQTTPLAFHKPGALTFAPISSRATTESTAALSIVESKTTATVQATLPIAQQDGETIEEFCMRRAVNGTLFVIPVNDGYVDFGLNLLCSIEKLPDLTTKWGGSETFSSRNGTVGQGFVFVAMDETAYKRLRKMNLPVVIDPDVPFVSSKSAAWADPNFHKLVCTKLIPVLRLLKARINVVLSDADIVFRHDPTPFLRDDLSLVFSLGSCHRDLADGYDFSAGDGIAKLNTGFYYASYSKPIVSMFERALKVCQSSHLTGDQPAINSVLAEDLAQAHRHTDHGLAYSYGFFDGCLFANGCIFFKGLCANTTMFDPRLHAGKSVRVGGKVKASKLVGREAVPKDHIRRDDPVLVHANFLVGKKDKIKHLRKYRLWEEDCIGAWRSHEGGV